MFKLSYALHKLRVKHATQQAIYLEDSVAATQPGYYVKNVIKHGQDGRGTLYLIFRNKY